MNTTQIPGVLLQDESILRANNPDQHEIAFSTETWRRQFPYDADLEAIFRNYPHTINRKQITELAFEAKSLESQALRQFMFGVMLWGFGTVGYGAYRTSRMLGSATAIQQLANTVGHLTRGDIQYAYERFQLPMCGPAFFTKVFYFIGLGCHVTPLPLILDSVVANALERKLKCDISTFARVSRDTSGKITYVYRWPQGYLRYVEKMNVWSQMLQCRADNIELFLFQSLS
jgi:hypothetical protein